MPELPSDEDQRKRIRSDLDATLFVEAGAGTGKTRELIERIVRLVSSGRTELRKIAAITFTEAAAAELRDRIRLRLEVLTKPAQGPEDELPEEERDRCSAALEQLDAAAIETLHGFAPACLAVCPELTENSPGFPIAELGYYPNRAPRPLHNWQSRPDVNWARQ